MPPQPVVAPRRRSLDTISIWALFITLALYILARLGRGNVIFPASALVGLLWLPVLAYALSAAFSGVSFTNAFWGIALEPDTLGFLVIAAVLGTLATLVLRRSEQYGSFLRAS